MSEYLEARLRNAETALYKTQESLVIAGDRASIAEKQLAEAREDAARWKDAVFSLTDVVEKRNQEIAKLRHALSIAEPYLYNTPLEGAIDVWQIASNALHDS
jgi:hypothetical protein